MNRSSSLLFASLALVLVSSTVVAAPSLEAWAKTRVEANLVKPLAKKDGERSRFSRGAPPPTERRVRVLGSELSKDGKGSGFVPYAIDVRYGTDEWHEAYLGCIYEKTGALFVAVGEEYRPAAYLLGKKAEPVPGVCQAAPLPART